MRRIFTVIKLSFSRRIVSETAYASFSERKAKARERAKDKVALEAKQKELHAEEEEFMSRGHHATSSRAGARVYLRLLLLPRLRRRHTSRKWDPGALYIQRCKFRPRNKVRAWVRNSRIHQTSDKHKNPIKRPYTQLFLTLHVRNL